VSTRAQRKGRTVEDYLVRSKEWKDFVDQECRAHLGYSLRDYLSKLHSGEVSLLDDNIRRIYTLCSQNWFDKEHQNL
jgi:hypothetical protein